MSILSPAQLEHVEEFYEVQPMPVGQRYVRIPKAGTMFVIACDPFLGWTYRVYYKTFDSHQGSTWSWFPSSNTNVFAKARDAMLAMEADYNKAIPVSKENQ